jgi:hypothetical protein
LATAASVGAAFSVTVSTSVEVLPATSRAVTVRTLLPPCNVIEFTLHEVVPVAVPLPPRLLTQLTCVTPPASLAVPLSDSVAVLVA